MKKMLDRRAHGKNGEAPRAKKWTYERFERMRNRVRKGQFSREGADEGICSNAHSYPVVALFSQNRI